MLPVVKLKGLPLTAKSRDIRAFFDGLLIPDGAVHVIGGSDGLAFVAFSTFEDAKQAVLYTNGEIHGSLIVVEWSNDTEMYEVIGELLHARGQKAYVSDYETHVMNPSIERHMDHLSESVTKPLRIDCSDTIASKQMELLTGNGVSRFFDANNFAMSNTTFDPQSYLSRASLPPQSDEVLLRPISAYNQQQRLLNMQHPNEKMGLSNILESPLTEAKRENPLKREQQEKKFYYVKLSNIPAEVSTTAALEDFLNPSVPLRLSSVKTIFDQNRFPLYFFVRLENVDDMQNALDKDGERKIRIQGCSQASFGNAVDGSIKKVKLEEERTDGSSSDDDRILRRSNSSAVRVQSDRIRSADRKSRSRSPLSRSKPEETKRFDKGRSPDSRSSEVTSSRKRKERRKRELLDRDRYSDYNRRSPSGSRNQKSSPRRSDRSSVIRKQELCDSDRSQSRNRSPLNNNSKFAAGDKEHNNVSSKKDIKIDVIDRQLSSTSIAKRTSKALIESSVPSSGNRAVSRSKERCLSAEENHGSISSIEVDSLSGTRSSISEKTNDDAASDVTVASGISKIFSQKDLLRSTNLSAKSEVRNSSELDASKTLRGRVEEVYSKRWNLGVKAKREVTIFASNTAAAGTSKESPKEEDCMEESLTNSTIKLEISESPPRMDLKKFATKNALIGTSKKSCTNGHLVPVRGAKTDGRCCVEFTNLPLSVTEDEVKDYLGYLSEGATLKRACFRDGKPSERWIAVFQSSELADQACHISGEIQNQIIVPRKLLEQEAALLLEGAKPLGTSLKDLASQKIKFSLGKDKQMAKMKQDKKECIAEGAFSAALDAEVRSSAEGTSEAQEYQELFRAAVEWNEANVAFQAINGTEEMCDSKAVGYSVGSEAGMSELSLGYHGSNCGTRNEQLWYLYNQYYQTYYGMINGPVDYMLFNGSRGRPVLIPDGPAEFANTYQYPSACFSSPVSPSDNASEHSLFGTTGSSKCTQRVASGHFRTPVTYSANPRLYKRRGAGGYEAKGMVAFDDKAAPKTESR